MTIKIVNQEVRQSMDPTKEQCTAVSVRANRDYIQALKVLASERGVQIGDLVREAIDQSFGASIQDKVLFFRKTDYQNSQIAEKTVNTGGAA